jgi:hypothetical protein
MIFIKTSLSLSSMHQDVRQRASSMQEEKSRQSLFLGDYERFSVRFFKASDFLYYITAA